MRIIPNATHNAAHRHRVLETAVTNSTTYPCQKISALGSAFSGLCCWPNFMSLPSADLHLLASPFFLFFEELREPSTNTQKKKKKSFEIEA